MAEQKKKLVPVIVWSDPSQECTFTIKPFAAGLATTPATAPEGSEVEGGTSVSGSGSNIGGNPDVDADADFN